MNEKTAKKVGEAYAFAAVLHDMTTEVADVLQTLLGDASTAIAGVTDMQKTAMAKHAESFNMSDVVLPKAERTGDKIKRMADMYVGDEWDNPVEVLEWLSFFVGAAIVHWQLIHGSAQALGDESFINDTKEGVVYYQSLMDVLVNYADDLGRARATE
jgi:hypothetical protein